MGYQELALWDATWAHPLGQPEPGHGAGRS
jgi:hypothetical protein